MPHPVQRRQDLDQQMRVRAVFDPDWRLNPGQGVPARGQDRGVTHGASVTIDAVPPRPRRRRLRRRSARAAATRKLAIVGGGTRAGLGRPSEAERDVVAARG